MGDAGYWMDAVAKERARDCPVTSEAWFHGGQAMAEHVFSAQGVPLATKLKVINMLNAAFDPKRYQEGASFAEVEESIADFVKQHLELLGNSNDLSDRTLYAWGAKRCIEEMADCIGAKLHAYGSER